MTPELPKAELLPCPFCGGKVETEHHTEWYASGPYGDRGWSVNCEACELHFGSDGQTKGSHNDHTTGDYSTEQDAILSWNTRAEVQPSPEAEKVAKEIVWTIGFNGDEGEMLERVTPILAGYAAAVRAQALQEATEVWQPIDTAPKDGTVINAVARYPDATAGFPTYISFMGGKWVANSRAPLHEVIPWAWRPRDGWPSEPPTQGGE